MNTRNVKGILRGIGVVALPLVLLVTLSACEERQPKDAGEFPPPARTEMPPLHDPAGGDTVAVTLTEHTIEMPDTLSPGPVVFNITNAGDAEHSFIVEGPALVNVLETTLMPGDTMPLRLELPPGNFTVYCPDDDHQQQGMSHDLTVRDQRTI